MFARAFRAFALLAGLCLCFSAQAEKRWTWNVASDFPSASDFDQFGFSDQRLLELGFSEGTFLDGLDDRLAKTTEMSNPNGEWSYVSWEYGHIGEAKLLVPKTPGLCGVAGYEKVLCFTGTIGIDPTPGVSLYPRKRGFRGPVNSASQVTIPSNDSVILRIGILDGREPGVCFTAPDRGTFLFTVMVQPIDSGMKNPVEASLYVNGVKTRDDKEPKVLAAYGETRHIRANRSLHKGGTICLAISATSDPILSAVRAMVSVTRLDD